MNKILRDVIIIIIILIDLVSALYLGIMNLFIFTKIFFITMSWWPAFGLFMVDVAMIGHLYIAWNLLKFTTSFHGGKS